MLLENLKISVIVPIYNEKKQYLEECISSICNQIYDNLEIILVDDGSDISCYEMCDEYAMKDQRIKVIHKENGGSLSARRKGIEAAKGDYVAFLDSDDWIELDLYKKIAEEIMKYGPDIITASNYYRNYADGRFIKAYDNDRSGFWTRNEFDKKVFPYFIKMDHFFDTEFPISMWAYLFRTPFARKVIQKIDDNIKTSEDYVFLMFALLEAESFAAISHCGHHYRSNINSKTHTMKNMKELLQPVYETVESAIENSQYDECSRDALKKKNLWHTYHALMLKDYKKLAEVTDDFLFPYSKVKKGSKMLIYGAGKLGKQIYSVIRDNRDYQLIGMIDKNWEMYRNQGMDVRAPEDILSLEYEYVIIAIVYVHVKNQVKKDLIEMGVDADKIAEVDLQVLDEKHLPF